MFQFKEYVEYKNSEPLLVECANLIVELQLDPVDYLEDKISRDFPEVYTLLNEQGCWSRMRTALGRGARAIGQGIGAAAGAVRDVWSGPQAQFQKAMKALEALQQQIGKLAPDAMTTGGGYPAMNLQTWFQNTIQELKNQQQQLPQRQATTVTTPYTAGMPTPGAEVAPEGAPKGV